MDADRLNRRRAPEVTAAAPMPDRPRVPELTDQGSRNAHSAISPDHAETGYP